HLTADDPAAEDREPPGCLLGTGGFTTRPCVGIRQAWDRGDRRTAAGADRDGMAGHELGARPTLVSHRDTAPASEATRAADEVDSVLLEPCGLARIVPVGSEGVASRGWPRCQASPWQRPANRRPPARPPGLAAASGAPCSECRPRRSIRLQRARLRR